MCGLPPPSARALDERVKTRLDRLRRIVDNATRARARLLSLSSLSGHPRLRTFRKGPANTVTPSGKGTVDRRIESSRVSSANARSLARSSSDVSAGGSLAPRAFFRFALFIPTPCSPQPALVNQDLDATRPASAGSIGLQPAKRSGPAFPGASARQSGFPSVKSNLLRCWPRTDEPVRFHRQTAPRVLERTCMPLGEGAWRLVGLHRGFRVLSPCSPAPVSSSTCFPVARIASHDVGMDARLGIAKVGPVIHVVDRRRHVTVRHCDSATKRSLRRPCLRKK